MKRLMIAAALGMILSGAAFAQDNQPGAEPSTNEPGTNDQQNSMDDKVMSGFYTDSTMSKMRSPDEVKAAWMAMSKEDQAAMKERCKGDVAANMQELCMSVNQM